MPNHLAVGVAKPTHHDSLGNRIVRAGAAKVVTKAVQPAVFKTSFTGERFWNPGCKRFDDFTYQDVPNSVWLKPAAARAEKHPSVLTW